MTIQTIERTSKRRKRGLLRAYALMSIGVVATFAAPHDPLGPILFCLAVLYLAIVKIRIWWHHG